MSELSIKEIFRIQTFQQIQNLCSKTTGMASYAVDLNGPVTSMSNATELYSEVIKKSDIASNKLNDAVNKAMEQSISTCQTALVVGESGLVEVAVPFLLKGEVIGAIVFGQVYLEKPDENELRKIAADMKIDSEKYIAAARKVKICPREQIQDVADTIFAINNSFIELSYQRYLATQKNESMSACSNALKDQLKTATNLLLSNERSVKHLSAKFDQLNKLSDSASKQLENTTETVKVIQDIALNTRILGFNASIEASRAKESGKGFGVIAQEVRSLADVSKNSAEKIEEIIRSIGETTNQIRTTVVETNEEVSKTFETMNGMTELLEEMSKVSDQII